MCLVEIEGIPKLQTSCSTPVRDGMVVHTRTDQVKHAQSAVVEFLLVNHPLDCPVCDKGGECPLQDISMGWGPGKSRMTDNKRHFEKPIELSPLVAIDRERCILCYRCVRFSQEVAEDEQLQLLERGDRTFVGTFDDRPYVAPFHGNITDLCPVGALTSYTYRFRARPWDIEQAGSVCTLCPSQCNVSFTVRDEQVKRVVARDNADVDDGWLCDRGRYGFEMFDAEERVRGPRLRGGVEVDWDEAIAKAAAALKHGGPESAAIVGDASNEEGYLVQRIIREALGSPHIDSRPSRGPGRETLLAPRPARALGPGPRHRQRRRDPRRRHRPPAQLPDPRPAHPQGDPPQRRQAGGRDRPPDGPRRRRRGGRPLRPGRRHLLPRRAGHACASRATSGHASDVAEVAPATQSASSSSGASASAARARAPPTALLDVADALDLAGKDGSGLLEVPEVTNARGLREAGCLPDAGPGFDRAHFPRQTGNGRSSARRPRRSAPRSSPAS